MSESESSKEPASLNISDDMLFEALRRVGSSLGLPIKRSDVETPSGGTSAAPDEVIARIEANAAQAGILIRETTSMTVDEVRSFIREGYPVLLLLSGANAADSGDSTTEGGTTTILFLAKLVGRNIEAVQISDQTKILVLSKRELGKLFSADPRPIKLLCKKQLECNSISASADHGGHGHGSHGNGGDGHGGDGHGGHGHGHPTPLRRFFGLLRLDRADIFTVVIFAFVGGTLSLATPLAVESLVNVVSWGTYLQPLIVLGLILLTCLGLAGFLGVLQAVVVELIQRRQYVRFVGDLAYRFPRANQASLVGEYPRELANRVFDIMTIQKASAVLLLDGVSIILTTFIGLVLLAFYHPFLLGFDIVLLISMISLTWILGRGGIRTSIEESLTKYRVAHWLQDVLSSPGVFKMGGGQSLSIERANQLTANYLNARQRQFRVVIRQVSFAIMLEVIASTSLLALGGWLVIDGQLTLGQLVASELVVTVVVGAFAKAGKSLEKFYDLMAGIDKVGHLIDIPTDATHEKYEPIDGPAEVTWSNLVFSSESYHGKVDSATIEAGSRAAIVGDDVDGRSLLARSFAGLAASTSGRVQVAGLDPNQVLPGASGRLVGYVGPNDIFHGSLRDNIDLGRSGVKQQDVRNALEDAGLSKTVLQLRGGLNTHLQTGGYPLSEMQTKLVILARAIVTRPKLLVIDGLLDLLAHDERQAIWSRLTAPDVPWTLVVNTNREDVANLCDVQLSVRKS